MNTRIPATKKTNEVWSDAIDGLVCSLTFEKRKKQSSRLHCYAECKGLPTTATATTTTTTNGNEMTENRKQSGLFLPGYSSSPQYHPCEDKAYCQRRLVANGRIQKDESHRKHAALHPLATRNTSVSNVQTTIWILFATRN